MSRRRNKKYSKELKIKAVEEFLAGKGSQLGICRKYEISNHTQLQEWIKVYNGHKKSKEPHGSGTEIYMTKGRKTTQQERAEIVTTNLPFSKWAELFENTTMVTALIDRLTFRSHVLDMNGESYTSHKS